VLHDGRLYIQHDNEGRSFLAAIDAKTGKELWSVVRSEKKFRSSGWATPFIWKHEARTEIVTIGQRAAISYDLEGKELWRMEALTGQATPTPSAVGDVLFVGAGSQGETNRPMFAIRAGATGNITPPKGETSNDFVIWSHPAATSYTPSPLVYRDRVYVVNDNGIFTSFDAKTGKVVYRARVGGGGQTFSASPWASDGRVFCLSEDGDTFIIEAGDEYKEVGRNTLGEMSFATPAVAHDSLFIRTATKLYRITRK
jgi:outer membrane protein assembly factor BamB